MILNLTPDEAKLLLAIIDLDTAQRVCDAAVKGTKLVAEHGPIAASPAIQTIALNEQLRGQRLQPIVHRLRVIAASKETTQRWELKPNPAAIEARRRAEGGS